MNLRHKSLFNRGIWMFLVFFYSVNIVSAGIVDSLIRASQEMNFLLSQENVIFTFTFIAMLAGTFSLFKALLSFVFKENSHFKRKEISVIAFMLSFIGTSGIYFIFSRDAEEFIYVFGGFFGLLIVLFVVFFMMRLFYQVAESVKNQDGKGKGPQWWFLMVLGSLLSTYLFQ